MAGVDVGALARGVQRTVPLGASLGLTVEFASRLDRVEASLAHIERQLELLGASKM
jgi:hypothetical protein